MFWGLIMEPNRRYTQVVKFPFHISMAALDIETSGDQPAQVICGYEGKHYLLCTLQKGKLLQCQLDLEFAAGKEVSFASNGSAHIHLTGYLTTDEMFGDMMMGEEEESEEEQEVKGKRAKKSKDGPPSKKSKTDILLNSTLETDEDDSDVSFSDLEEEDVDGEGDLEEESDDENDLEEEEDDDEDLEDEEMEDDSEEEEAPAKKGKMNGVQSKAEKKKEALKQKEQKQKTKEKPVKEKADKKKGTPEKENKADKGTPQKKTIEGGVGVQDLKIGNGSVAKAGNYVTVYYEGRLKSNNKVFDAVKKGAGFKFRLGKSEVIKGWDYGLVGMKVGGKRRITCPPHVAYGPKGSPPVIPPNATLIFDVELRNAQ